MPCLHKFYKYLDLEKLDFMPTTLIVGTFNPSWPENNQALWFYGRTANNYFWEVLPQVFGLSSLIKTTPEIWKKFCKEHHVAITDMIRSIRDAESGNEGHKAILKDFSDSGIIKNFSEFEFVDIISILEKHPSIQKIYFTRSISDPFWRELWKPAIEYIKGRGLSFSELLTPSGNARFQFGVFKRKNPSSRISMADYITMKWKEKFHCFDNG